MVSILQLPSEVVVQIFQYLSPKETLSAISKLKQFQNETNVEVIINLMYQRLFNGKLVIVNEDPWGKTPCDTLLTVNSFEDVFHVDSYENHLFKDIRPNSVEFKFTRQANDYSNYIGNLFEFNRLLEGENKQLYEYFTKALRMAFYADANLMMIENPTSLSTILIKILINLAKHEPMTRKFYSLTIKSTDIGNIYVPQWVQLFKRFSNLETLDLSDNSILSKYDDAQDVLALFQLPPTLKNLILDGNYLSDISEEFIRVLPKGLEVLSLNNNRISKFLAQSATRTSNDNDNVNNSELSIRKILPKLVSLSLSRNRLNTLNPALFSAGNPKCSCTNLSFTLELKGTVLNQTEFKEYASSNGFSVVF